MLKKLKYVVAGGLLATVITTPVWGDDTEVFFGRNAPQNILLALDVSGSMDQDSNVAIIKTGRVVHPGENNHADPSWVDRFEYTRYEDEWTCVRYWWWGSCRQWERERVRVDYYSHEQEYVDGYKSKLQVMKEAAEVFINGLSDARVGLLTYPHNGSYARIEMPVTELDSSSRAELIEKIKDLRAGGGTPITAALHTSAVYFQGDYSGYDSPILSEETCPIANNVVLLTDGSPGSTADWTVNRVNDMLDDMVKADGSDFDRCYLEPDNRSAGGNPAVKCAYSLSEALFNNNQISGGQVKGDATTNVTVHTIGFGNNGDEIDYDDRDWNDILVTDYLKNIARFGGGQYKYADDVENLAEAFKSLTDTTAENAGFVAPSVPLSQSNRLETDDKVYLAMFQPLPKATWPGNLKQYMYTTIDVEENGVTKKQVVLASVANGVATSPAVSDQGGTFVDDAQSGWNNIIDGNVVPKSGVSANLSDDTTYSNLDSDTLTSSNNLLTQSNNSIDDDELLKLFKTTSVTARQLLSWFDDRTTIVPDPDNPEQTITVNRMGDPLHSRPQIMDYNKTIRYGFFATNQGYLHAVDLTTGQEKWSFFPRQLLENVEEWAANGSLANQNFRRYGLDGDITLYKIDSNKDGDYVDTSDKVYLFVGMRRGGTNYYVLDVTERDNPKMVFTVRQSEPASGEYEDYTGERSVEIDNLGQTWSQPVVGKIKTGADTYKTVMMFGGGYDTYYDDLDNPVNPSSNTVKGDNLYIIDLDMDANGNIGSPSLMADANTNASGLSIDNSIAADISAIDLNSDGYIDRVYAADVGGKIYRLDFPFDGDQSKLSGATVADFSGAAANRFYNKPDVSYSVYEGKFFAAVAIGSGMRPNPLNQNTSDRFYVVFDQNAVTPTTAPVIGEGDLLNVTDKKPAQGQQAEDFYGFEDIVAAGKDGWYFNLQPGEKVLSDSVTTNFNTFFTTYKPGSVSETECAASIGTNRVYGVGLLSGKPTVPGFDADGDGSLTDIDDRFTEIDYSGIAPPPTQLFPAETGGAIAVGTDIVCVGEDCGFDTNTVKTVRWKQEK